MARQRPTRMVFQSAVCTKVRFFAGIDSFAQACHTSGVMGYRTYGHTIGAYGKIRGTYGKMRGTCGQARSTHAPDGRRLLGGMEKALADVPVFQGMVPRSQIRRMSHLQYIAWPRIHINQVDQKSTVCKTYVYKYQPSFSMWSEPTVNC